MDTRLFDGTSPRALGESDRTSFTVSIVIPTFNRAALVVQSIESALEQTSGDFEIIVVDDGSSDDTARVLERFGDRISYFYQQNAGLSAARNRGMREARGQWVAFLDSDDLWERERLASLLRFAQAHPNVGYITTGRRMIDLEGRPTGRRYSWRGRDCIIAPQEILTGVLPGGGFVRRDLAERVGGFDPLVVACEDVDFCLRLSPHCELAELGAPLLLQRIHGRTLSRSHLPTALGRLRILEKLEREQPEFVARHRWPVRRFVAAAHSRMGRVMMLKPNPSEQDRRLAIEHFTNAVRNYPFQFRNWRYLAMARIAPNLYQHMKRSGKAR